MKRSVIYFALVAILVFSCRKILFNEEESSRQFVLDPFHAVAITGNCNLVLIQDSADKLIITGNNDVNSVTAVVKNDTLLINNHNKLSFNQNINTLYLHFSQLGYMVSFYPIKVTNTDTLKAERFVYDAIGEIAEVRLQVDCNYFIVSSSANTLGTFHFNRQSQ